MAPFLQPPQRPYSLIEMTIWYTILYLKGLIVMGALFYPLYLYDAAIYWLVSVMFAIAFAGHEWVRGHRKKYGISFGRRVQLLTWISYPVSVVSVALIYLQHFTDITAIAFISAILEIKYTLLQLSLIIHFSSFWIGVLFYVGIYSSNPDLVSEKVLDIGLIIKQWFSNNRKRQLIAGGCVYLMVGIAIYLTWFY